MGLLDNTGVTRLLNDIKPKFTAPKSIAYVESTTAKTNHAAGDHFMIGEQLKRATSAIATGETIGTSNSADDTVQGQIDTLRDSVDPSQITVNIWGFQLITYRDTSSGSQLLLTTIPKPYGKTITRVQKSGDSSFTLIRINDTESTINNVSITSLSIVRVSDPYVVVTIGVNKTLTDNAIYRTSWGVPDIIIS